MRLRAATIKKGRFLRTYFGTKDEIYGKILFYRPVTALTLLGYTRKISEQRRQNEPSKIVLSSIENDKPKKKTILLQHRQRFNIIAQ